MLFTESTFVRTIEVLREQSNYDQSYSRSIESLFGAENVPLYQNHLLTNHLFLLLQEQFPPKNGVCEIERYCWELNFGFTEGVQMVSPSDLYHRLTTNSTDNNFHELKSISKPSVDTSLLDDYYTILATEGDSIYKLRRSSDDVVFSVGDLTNKGVIHSFQIKSGILSVNVGDQNTLIRTLRHATAYELSKQNPVYVEQGRLIQKEETEDGSLFDTHLNKAHQVDELYYEVEKMIASADGNKIHSVRRFIDNEVFTVGDKLKGDFTITGFLINAHNHIFIITDKEISYLPLIDSVKESSPKHENYHEEDVHEVAAAKKHVQEKDALAEMVNEFREWNRDWQLKKGALDFDQFLNILSKKYQVTKNNS
jgi:hypothetical protein